jgi:hypothetical protein
MLVPEMAGENWNPHAEYFDGITFAVQGNTVAAAFINFGNDGYGLKSYDNGETWENIKFFDSPVGRYISPSEYDNTVYIPTQGCIALDYNGKVHVTFSVVAAMNHEEEGQITYFSGVTASFLSYWNEDMAPIDGDNDFVYSEIYPIVYNYFDWDLSDEERLYVKSTVPKWPIIGYFTPGDDHYFRFRKNYSENLYCTGDWFSFPQMAFDATNKLHLTYLGLIDNGFEDARYLHHPFYTTTEDGGLTWTETEYLVKTISLIDKEFAYLTLAGFGDNKMYLMAQVDQYAGTYTGGHHAPTDNCFYHFYINSYPPPFCPPVTNAKATIESSCTSATLTWNAVSGATQYSIERDGTLLGTVTVPEFIENAKFEHGQSYTWTITTICNNGLLGHSSVSATADCSDINEVSTGAMSVQVYPNPANSTITINAKDFTKVEVYNTVGQLVETRIINTVDVSSYNTGIYFFKVFDVNNNCVTKRIMVAR